MSTVAYGYDVLLSSVPPWPIIKHIKNYIDTGNVLFRKILGTLYEAVIVTAILAVCLCILVV